MEESIFIGILRKILHDFATPISVLLMQTEESDYYAFSSVQKMSNYLSVLRFALSPNEKFAEIKDFISIEYYAKIFQNIQLLLSINNIVIEISTANDFLIKQVLLCLLSLVGKTENTDFITLSAYKGNIRVSTKLACFDKNNPFIIYAKYINKNIDVMDKMLII